jgi:arylsulfatase A-like enzyme
MTSDDADRWHSAAWSDTYLTRSQEPGLIPINARLPIGAPTPNLDRLASEGMRFVNYYGQASCTAGRASFITGRIPIRTSLSAVLAPGDPNGLTKQTPTIAQYLK